MATHPPLQILFRQSLAAVKQQLQTIGALDGDIVADVSRNPSGQRRALQLGSLGFEMECSDVLPSYSGYRTVFFDPELSRMQTILSLSFGSNLAGGERAVLVAQSLLILGAKLGKLLSADAIVWNPGRLISEPNFFIETVSSYADGGAFPVLVTVDLEYQNDERALRSTGLFWFSGQEIELGGCGLHGQELTRRAVRLIHDIAVNGPVNDRQTVADIESNLEIELIPPTGAGIMLQCHIHLKSDVQGISLMSH